MAISASCQWEVRGGTGNDNNGGGFVEGASGTDRSQANASHATLSAASTVNAATTIIDVALGDHTVAAADIGNVLQVHGGTATAGFYEITAVNVGANQWTVDRACGAAAATVVGDMGGALATISKVMSMTVATELVNGQEIFADNSADYTELVSWPAGWVNPVGDVSRLRGYEAGTTRTIPPSAANRPTITGGGVRANCITFVNTNVDNVEVWDFNFTLATGHGTTGVDGSTPIFVRCRAHNNTGGGFAGRSKICYFCEADNNGDTGWVLETANRTWEMFYCYAHDNMGGGFNDNSIAQGGDHIFCIAESNTEDGFNLNRGSAHSRLLHCVAYNNTLAGYQTVSGTGTVQSVIYGSIFSGNGTFGVVRNGVTNPPAELDFNLYFDNDSGNLSNLTAGPNDIEDQDPQFTDPANGDFSLAAGSPCIGTGPTFPGGTTDLNLNIGPWQGGAGGAAELLQGHKLVLSGRAS